MSFEIRPVPADIAAFVQSRVTVHLAAADASLVPQLSLGLGCRVADDGRDLLIALSDDRAAPLLPLLHAGSRVALVFCRPTTLRTVQIKGRCLRIAALPARQAGFVAERMQAMLDEFDRIGFGGAYAATLLAHDTDRLIGVQVAPTDFFDQTPGPRAGEAIG